MSGLLVALPRLPQLPTNRLLADHIDNGTGRCKACSMPQGGLVTWPCTLHATAVAAVAALEARPRRRR